MKSLAISCILVFGFALATPVAFSYPAKEADVLLTTSYALATAAQKNRRGAEAFCREANSKLSKTAQEAYLYAYIERCYGAVADAFGDTKNACRRFKSAIEIWDKTPPPDDHPQSVASRSQLRMSMQRYRAEKCQGK